MRSWSAIFFVVVFLAFAEAAEGQAKRNSRQPAKPVTAASPAPTPVATPTPERGKRNERPASTQAENGDPQLPAAPVSLYRYEFTQPDFLVSRIVIEHDDRGAGTISFTRKSFDEPLTENIQVSELSLEKLRSAFEALNFIDSSVDYQFERDFSHLGNTTITLRTGGKERTAKYNWTTDKNAKILMDEYRRLGNQFVWVFDFNLARENQPLETPKLVESLDGLLKRNEISDPMQMLPFLVGVSNDERVPLIGRNRAGKLVKQIEKQKN